MPRSVCLFGFEFFDKDGYVMFVGKSGCMGDWGFIEDMTLDDLWDFYLTHTDAEMFALIESNR